MSFNHHLFFSMGKINCSLPEQDVVDRMQLLIDHAYQGNRIAAVKYFKVLDADNCEFAIERYMDRDHCLAIGHDFIGEYDEALLTGLEPCYFSLFPGSKITPVVAPLIPMGQAFYTPKECFTQFWKGLNKGHAGKKIQRIRIDLALDEVVVHVKYPRSVSNPTRYADDVYDLELELNSPLSFFSGQTISWQLWEMGEICYRKHVWKKSYKGLQDHLKKQYNITLEITS